MLTEGDKNRGQRTNFKERDEKACNSNNTQAKKCSDSEIINYQQEGPKWVLITENKFI